MTKSSIAVLARRLRTPVASWAVAAMLAPTAFAGTAGTLDQSWNAAGPTPGMLIGPEGQLYSLAAQPDGKVVVGGTLRGTSGVALLRYRTDGTPDPTFGSTSGGETGRVTIPLGDGTAAATGLLVQDDGKLVAGGSALVGRTAGFALLRVTHDGTLDTTFNAGGPTPGKATAIVGAGRNTSVWATQREAAGKLLLAGATQTIAGETLTTEMVIARFTADGVLDTAFNSTGPTPGLAVVPAPAGFERMEAYGLAVQPDGKAVLVGQAVASSIGRLAIARIAADGTLDTTFGAGEATPGVVLLPTGPTSEGTGADVTVLPDGKLLVIGTAPAATTVNSSAFVVARLRADGTLDEAFNPLEAIPGEALAQVTDPAPSGSSIAHSLAVRPDGQLLVGGEAILIDESASGEPLTDGFALARLTADGMLDTTFDPAGDIPGTAVTLFPEPEYVSALEQRIVVTGGKVVAGGIVTRLDPSERIHPFKTNIALLRYFAEPTATGTSLEAAPNPAADGTPVTLTATVTAVDGSATPTGTVSFFEGLRSLGAPVTLDATGRGAFTLTGLAVGAYAIKAVYSGDDDFEPSDSAPLDETVLRATEADLACAPQRLRVGRATNCTVVVSDASAGRGSRPTGTATWSTDGDGSFDTNVCTLNRTSRCSVSYTPSGTGTGSVTLTVRYLSSDGVHAAGEGVLSMPVR